MIPNRRVFLCAALLLVAPLVFAKGPEDAIQKQIGSLRDVSPAQRPSATVKLASDIRALPAGKNKANLASDLAHLATEGDQGADTIQAVADTLSQALAETPIPAKKTIGFHAPIGSPAKSREISPRKRNRQKTSNL